MDPDITFSHAVELVETIGIRPAGSEGNLLAGQYILETFSLLGLEDPRFQHFTQGSVEGRNVVATLRGTHYPSSILLLGAHYDSIPQGVGSADNATGVPTLLEIARHHGDNPPAYTLRFVAFGAEYHTIPGSLSEIDKIGLAVTTKIILEFLIALQDFLPEDLQIAGSAAFPWGE